MTIFCVIISVLLVTTIFSVADMFIRAQSEGLQQKHGNWHIRLENIIYSNQIGLPLISVSVIRPKTAYRKIRISRRCPYCHMIANLYI